MHRFTQKHHSSGFQILEYASLRHNSVASTQHFAKVSLRYKGHWMAANPYEQKMDHFAEKASLRQKIVISSKSVTLVESVTVPKESQLIWASIIRTVTLFRPSDAFWQIVAFLTKICFFRPSDASLAKWRILGGWKRMTLVAKWRVHFSKYTWRKFLSSLKAMI